MYILFIVSRVCFAKDPQNVISGDLCNSDIKSIKSLKSVFFNSLQKDKALLYLRYEPLALKVSSLCDYLYLDQYTKDGEMLPFIQKRKRTVTQELKSLISAEKRGINKIKAHLKSVSYPFLTRYSKILEDVSYDLKSPLEQKDKNEPRS